MKQSSLGSIRAILYQQCLHGLQGSPCALRAEEQSFAPSTDAPRAAVSANWLAMKAAISLPAPFKRQGSVISTAAPTAAATAPAKGPGARGALAA